MRIFTGIECEGMHRGAKTLFVEGLVPLVKISDYLKQTSSITQVYFGAGKKDGDPSVLRVHTAVLLASMFPSLMITLETNMDLLAFEALERYQNIWLMIPIVTRNGHVTGKQFLDYLALRSTYVKSRTQVKILGDHFTFVAQAGDFVINARSEAKADVTVWTADD